MGRGVIEPERPVKVTDLLIRQKAEAMILWAYSALRQFPKWERHVLAAEMRRTLWSLLRLIVVCNRELPPGSLMPSTPRPGACDRNCWAN